MYRLGELLDGVSPSQPHSPEEHDDDLVELLRPTLTDVVHVDRNVLDHLHGSVIVQILQT